MISYFTYLHYIIKIKTSKLAGVKYALQYSANGL